MWGQRLHQLQCIAYNQVSSYNPRLELFRILFLIDFSFWVTPVYVQHYVAMFKLLFCLFFFVKALFEVPLIHLCELENHLNYSSLLLLLLLLLLMRFLSGYTRDLLTFQAYHFVQRHLVNGGVLKVDLVVELRSQIGFIGEIKDRVTCHQEQILLIYQFWSETILNELRILIFCTLA
jgi:hypothetical protein